MVWFRKVAGINLGVCFLWLQVWERHFDYERQYVDGVMRGCAHITTSPRAAHVCLIGNSSGTAQSLLLLCTLFQ